MQNSPLAWVGGKRQSLEFMEHVKSHARAQGLAARAMNFDFWCEDEKYNVKASRVTLPNGSRIIGLPANPDTARGFSGNLILDEYAFHQNARKIWKAVFPIVSRGGYKLRIVSTHNGKDSHFYEICTADDETWSRHRTFIHQAVEEGCPQDITELRAAINDEDTWQEEFEGIPLDGAENWIPIELITDAESAIASSVIPHDWNPEGDLYIGWDIGRKKDLTVIWLIEKTPNTGILVTRAVEVMKRETFAKQSERISWYLDQYPIQRACGDATGLGMQLAEHLREKYGSRVEPIEFTLKVKEDLAVTIKRCFEERTIRIPASADIRADIRAIKKYTTSANHPRFDAERSERGHSDRFWACALALHAGSGPTGKIEYQRAPIPKRMSAGLRGAF
jgi:phage FluMu gp28-like protein